MPPTASPLTGAILAAALLLLATGALKIVRPEPTAAALVQAGGMRGARPLARLVGAIELAIAVLALAIGGRLPAAGLACAYAAFTAFVVMALRRPERIRTCGCGGTETPPTAGHAALNAAFAAAAAVAAGLGTAPSIPDLLAALGAEGIVLLGYAGVVALLAWAVITVLPLARQVGPSHTREER